MAVTIQTARSWLELAGLELTTEQIERLLPRVERHLAQMHALAALDLGDGDPRRMAFVRDNRPVQSG